jgi:predicted component of type VI protein secretion system
MDLVTRAGRRYPVAGLVRIGRDAECEIRPADVLVSRVHAVVWEQAGEVRVRDEGSSNGTYVNGTRLPARQTRVLALGDQVQVGTTLLTLAAGTGPQGGMQVEDYETLVEPVEAGTPGATGPAKPTAPLSAEGAGRPTAAHAAPPGGVKGQPVGVKLLLGVAIGCGVVLLMGLCALVGVWVATGNW